VSVYEGCDHGNGDNEEKEGNGSSPKPPLSSFTPGVRSPSLFLEWDDLVLLCDWRWD
jgi:hypothetical protein